MRSVTLCGSTRFMDDFTEANIELTKRGHAVLTISMALDKEDTGVEKNLGLKEYLDLVHLNKILIGDVVFIVGDGYIGRSTAREILWADMQGKPIIFIPPVPHVPSDLVEDIKIDRWDVAARAIRQGFTSVNIVQNARKVLGV